MRKPSFQGISRAWILGIFFLAGLSGCRRPMPEGPVVIYLVDTLRFDRMSAYGAARPTTPAAERLAREGVRYDAAYSTASWTRPAIASLFTSLLPSEVGAFGTGGALDRNAPVIMDKLLQHEWVTAAFCGQSSIFSPPHGFRRGFTEFQAVRPLGEEIDGRLNTADRVVDPAIRWLNDQTDPRFFLYVHVVDPHNGDIERDKNPYRHWLPGYENLFAPAGPPQLDSRAWRLAKYDALVRQADDQFARLRSALERKGFWKNALVLYVADHGEEFFEHEGLYHGHSLFEELVRVPFILKAPGRLPPGTTVKTPVSLLDVAPTVADWAGASSDSRWRGKSLFKLDPHEVRTLFLSEEWEGCRLYGLRQGNRKLIVSLTPPYRVEFDLARDPSERNPIPDDPSLEERLERLRGFESSLLGGLWLRKTDAVSMQIDGRIALPGDGTPYFSIRDYQKFPIDPSDPNSLPIHLNVGAQETFAAHFVALQPQDDLVAHITVRENGQTHSSARPTRNENLGGLKIDNVPVARLSVQELMYDIQRLRALGYLGGH